MSLPPPNPKAGGLRLTDAEWDAVKSFTNDHDVEEVWVFGSRASGVRTNQEPSRSSDIDLAVRLGWTPEVDGKDTDRAIAYKARHRETLARFPIQIDWHRLGDASDQFHTKGIRIWPAPG